MNKLELIKALSNTMGMPKSIAEAVVNLLFNEMTVALGKGDRVEIRG